MERSKAFVLSFSQALWAETRGSGVTVTALCPGATRTGFVDALDADVSQTAVYKRLASPEPVVAAGLRAMDRGRPVVVPGLRNRLMATASRLSPGWVGALISGRMLRPDRHASSRSPRRNDHRQRRQRQPTRPAQMVAEVRDDPAGRIRLATDAYAFRRGGRRYRPYGKAVVAFMRWQRARGVLNPLDADMPGSPWWRAVNEDLLRDTIEAKLLVAARRRTPVTADRRALGRVLRRTVRAVVVRRAQRERRRRLPCALGTRHARVTRRAILHERRPGAGAVRARAGARR